MPSATDRRKKDQSLVLEARAMQKHKGRFGNNDPLQYPSWWHDVYSKDAWKNRNLNRPVSVVLDPRISTLNKETMHA